MCVCVSVCVCLCVCVCVKEGGALGDGVACTELMSILAGDSSFALLYPTLSKLSIDSPS